MRVDRALLVFHKDWLEVRRNWQVVLPVTIIPLLFSVFIPVVFFFAASIGGSSSGDFGGLIGALPPDVQAALAGMTTSQVMVYVMVVYFFAPFFLIIPLMASSVIASDSFAGEKERKTIEGLLATPLSDSELMLGKILVSFVPSMGVTLLAFAAYCATIDALGYGLFGRLIMPNVNWLVLILGVAPLVALAAIGLTVMISARVKGFREAQQISVVLILPVLGLLFAQVSGLFVLGPVVMLELMAVFVVVDVFLFRLGLSLFGREEILSHGG